MGLLTNSHRGVWALTEKGSALLHDPTLDEDGREAAVQQLRSQYLERMRLARKGRGASDVKAAAVEDPATESRSWKELLLDAVMEMKPDAFERLAKRLLREADFESVTVTGRSGDQGIDGVGVYRFGLLSFPVFFQCKRYRGSVGPGAVRDFRGAMSGRGDKGLLITTGTFTAEARREATRDGAPPVDLIDGERLSELLKKYEVGVTTVIRPEEDVPIDGSFFAEL
jgi:restriction system protein